MECSINNPPLQLLMRHIVFGQRQKAPNFSAFHWSPHGSLVSIAQHFMTTNINTETEIIADLSCNSWLHKIKSSARKMQANTYHQNHKKN